MSILILLITTCIGNVFGENFGLIDTLKKKYTIVNQSFSNFTNTNNVTINNTLNETSILEQKKLNEEQILKQTTDLHQKYNDILNIN
ncbi:MAG: hypothetical protein ACPKPY_07095 [Nitrososphaeraceae archaeon]